MFPLVAPEEKIVEARLLYGRTIQEMISKMPQRDLYNILGAVEVLVGSKIAQGYPTSSSERMVFALTWLAREVGTGGFRQFFVNSAGDFWKDVQFGLQLIGDHAGFMLFNKVINIFPHATPSKDRLTRLQQLHCLEEKDARKLSNHFNGITAKYFKEPFPNWELVFRYVKAHPEEFDLRNA